MKITSMPANDNDKKLIINTIRTLKRRDLNGGFMGFLNQIKS